MEHLVWWTLLLAVACSVFCPWPTRSRVNDPVSALVASIGEALAASAPEALAAAGPEVAAGTAAAADTAALAPELAATALPDVAATTLPDVVVSAAAPEAAGAAALPEVAAGAGALAGVDAATGATDALSGFSGSSGGAVDLSAGASGMAASPTTLPMSPTLAVGGSGAAIPPAPAAPTLTGDVSGLSDIGGAPTGTAGGGTGGTLSGPAAGTPDAGLKAVTDAFQATDAAAGTSPTGGTGILQKLGLGGVSDFFKENRDLLTVGGAAIPLLSLFTTKSKLPGETGATQGAGSLAATGAGLMAGASHGVLPAGYENAIAQAKSDAAAAIRSQYAQLGQTGSTSEAQDIAAAMARIDGQRAVILDKLTSQGIEATGAATSADIELAKLQLTQDQELQTALGNLSKNLVLASLPARLTNIGA